MTEGGRNSVYRRIAPWLGEHGVPTRIENAIASGTPDVIYAAKGNLIYIELKMIEHGKIILRPYQNAYASRCYIHLNPQYFWFLCADNEYKMYMFKTLRPHIQKEIDKKLIVDLKPIKPDFILTKDSVKAWLQYIKCYET